VVIVGTPPSAPKGLVELLAQPLATVLAGAGAIFAALIAWQAAKTSRDKLAEQFQDSHTLETIRGLRDRYTAIVAQLADPSVAVRSAGAYAMGALADDWLARDQPKEAQACVNVLCSYLRVPYSLTGAQSQRRVKTVVRDGNDGFQEQEYAHLENDAQVRWSIVDVIAAHLQPYSTPSWSSLSFDFSGAYMHNAGFGGAVFNTKVLFSNATFDGKVCVFANAVFSGPTTWFDGAVFDSAANSFENTDFGGTRVSFGGAHFNQPTSFELASFHAADEVTFVGAHFSVAEVTFANPRAWGTVRFDWSDQASKPQTVKPATWPPTPLPS
jgi:hypothetical protein